MSTEETMQQVVPCQTMMRRHGIEYRRQGADAQRVMVGEGDMMFATGTTGEADMAAALARDLIAEPPQGA